MCGLGEYMDSCEKLVGIGRDGDCNKQIGRKILEAGLLSLHSLPASSQNLRTANKIETISRHVELHTPMDKQMMSCLGRPQKAPQFTTIPHIPVGTTETSAKMECQACAGVMIFVYVMCVLKLTKGDPGPQI